MDSKNRDVLVIGGSGGIGTAICKTLSERGWGIVVADRVKPEFTLKDTIFYPIDLTDPEATESCCAKIKSNHPYVQALIYTAGVYEHFPLAEHSEDELQRLFNVNILGVMRVVREIFPVLSRESGRIIVISSETAMISMPFQAYATSKRMLEVYLDALRQEMSFIGIPVIAIRPGAHQTDLLIASKSKLGDIPAASHFRPFLEVVRKTGEDVIDRGGADPKIVADVVMKALEVSKPAASYSVNVAMHFRMLRMFPRSVVRMIFRKMLRQ